MTPWLKMGLKNKRIGLALLVTVFAFAFSTDPVSGQDDEYWQVVSRRAQKIVGNMELEDKGKEVRVQDIIAWQYYHLSKIHDARDEEIAKIKENTDLNDASKQDQIEEIRSKANKQVKKLHKTYLADLSAELSREQVDMVKDGMTYGLVEHTYNAYLSLLPDLTEEQKEKIMDWLVEAREIAMDAGSSEEKHKWFGKYKGKINNYLSAEGYDLKKAERERK